MAGCFQRSMNPDTSLWGAPDLFCHQPGHGCAAQGKTSTFVLLRVAQKNGVPGARPLLECSNIFWGEANRPKSRVPILGARTHNSAFEL